MTCQRPSRDERAKDPVPWHSPGSDRTQLTIPLARAAIEAIDAVLAPGERRTIFVREAIRMRVQCRRFEKEVSE